MRIKLDENLPDGAADVLRAAGHDAVTVLDQGMGGGVDPVIAEVCKRESRALVTLDLDFADIRAYAPASYSSSSSCSSVGLLGSNADE